MRSRIRPPSPPSLHPPQPHQPNLLRRVIFLPLLLSLLTPTLAQSSFPEHFWVNVGGGGLPRFGPDPVGLLTGSSRTVLTTVPVSYAWAAALSSARVGASFGYNFRVAEPGEYSCLFHFAELQGAAPGARVFNVNFNGARRVGVDVAREAGANVGWAFGLGPVPDRDGVLQLRLSGQAGAEAMLGAVTCSRNGAKPGPLPDSSASPVPSGAPPSPAPSLAPVEENPVVVSTRPAVVSSTVPVTTTTTTTTAAATTTTTAAATTTTSTSGTTTAAERSLPKADEPLVLEDDEFAQSFDIEVDVEQGASFSGDDVSNLKDVLAKSAATGDADDWALASIAAKDVEAARFVVRQEGDADDGDSASSVSRLQVAMLARLRKGTGGEKAFNNVVDFVGASDGRAAEAMRDAGSESVSRMGFVGGKAPKLSAEAADDPRSADDDDEDEDEDGGGSSRVGPIVGGVLGTLALLALLGGIAFMFLRRKTQARSRDFDAPPPPGTSFLPLSEPDVEQPDSVFDSERRSSNDDGISYLEDPDSRLTGATSDADFVEESSGIGINKDVWGRGTGSDY